MHAIKWCVDSKRIPSCYSCNQMVCGQQTCISVTHAIKWCVDSKHASLLLMQSNGVWTANMHLCYSCNQMVCGQQTCISVTHAIKWCVHGQQTDPCYSCNQMVCGQQRYPVTQSHGVWTSCRDLCYVLLLLWKSRSSKSVRKEGRNLKNENKIALLWLRAVHPLLALWKVSMSFSLLLEYFYYSTLSQGGSESL